MNDAAIILGAFTGGILICLIAGWIVGGIDAGQSQKPFTVIDDDEDDYIGAD